ncbi:hypothetical protein BDV26DRAFT_296891 [Aspergillus bertholletiae]|uniref:Uncharacterized protein n=1 Tax=Aspergillus bertholletiae TaxID=1226010 RepID=A0A5N7AUI1_9EURO|nr:hypothetical protein BDV26DRAFT_296891 [Aspergillus bertholletiae]
MHGTVCAPKQNHLMFNHAGKNRAQVSILGRAGTSRFRNLSCKATGEKGMITFDYLIDATGRAGLVSTKYMKNRRYNQVQKTIASWGTGATPAHTELERLVKEIHTLQHSKDGFNRTFDLFRASTADEDKNLTQTAIAQIIYFCVEAFQTASSEEQDAVMAKGAAINVQRSTKSALKQLDASSSVDERRILTTILSEDTMDLDHFTIDVIERNGASVGSGVAGPSTGCAQGEGQQREDGLRATLSFPEEQNSIFSY